MVMQVRDGSGKGWYAPNRDLAYVLPSLVSATLHAMGDCKAVPNIDAESVGKVAVALAKIFLDIAGDKPPDKFAVLERLLELEKEQPAAVREVCWSLFKVLMGAYRQWVGEVRPKTPDDKPLETAELKQLLARFASPEGKS